MSVLYAVKFRKAGGEWEVSKPKGMVQAIKDLKAIKGSMNYDEITLVNWDTVLKEGDM